MKVKKQTKQGISLIVLVITIIVMIILAAAVILSLSSNGIIDRANEAVDKTDKAQVQNLASMLWAEAYLDGNRERERLRAEVVKSLKERGITEQDYVVFASENGVEVVPKESWEHIYTYSQTTGWSSKLTKENEIEYDDVTITAKFYKTGKKVKLLDEAMSLLSEMGITIEPEQDEYKLVISGVGDMGVFIADDESGFYAWQEEFFKLITGEQVIPSSFFTTEAIIEEGIENFGECAFVEFFSLANITIPSSVSNLGVSTFEGCFSLTNVIIPKDVTSIYSHTFSMCSNLNNIIIPNGVINVEYHAFYGCDSLKTVNYTGTEEQWQQITIDSNNEALTNAKINYNYVTN